jgi:hypothetical protein
MIQILKARNHAEKGTLALRKDNDKSLKKNVYIPDTVPNRTLAIQATQVTVANMFTVGHISYYLLIYFCLFQDQLPTFTVLWQSFEHNYLKLLE